MLSSKSLFLCTQAMSSNSSSLPAVTGSPSSSSNSIKTSSTESLLLFALCLCSAMLAYIHTVFVDVHNVCLFTIAKVLTFEVLSLVTAARTLAHAGQLHKRPRLLLRKLHSKHKRQRSLICSHTLLLAVVQVVLADRSR